MMHSTPEKVSPYANGSLRFRKAYIRERLAALKTEREALIAEREDIDRKLSNGIGHKSKASDNLSQ